MKRMTNQSKSGLVLKLTLILTILVLFSLEMNAQDQKNRLTTSGFSEVTFESSYGDPADADDLEKFEMLGGDDELTEETKRLSFPGLS